MAIISKRNLLKFIFLLPGLIGGVRVGVTIWFMISNVMEMSLRFIQIIPMLSIMVTLFMYYKLFSDGVPIVTVLAPTILHVILIYLFRKEVEIIPFIPLIILDICYLGVKTLKGTMYPFDIDGDEEEFPELEF